MNRKILAFVHINKAAGTTLTHVLRLNFFMRHVDVQALSKPSQGVFEPVDMKKIIIINPFVRSIAGHAIKPYNDFSDTFPGIRYITLLRDPIQRTISHYHYSVNKHGSNLTFEEYLRTPESLNRQTRAIAGSEDIDIAKQIISNRFFLVGIVEEFDEFLILLKKKLHPRKLKISYRLQNVAGKDYIREKIEKHLGLYHNQIIQRNLLDIELYNYIKSKILPKEKEKYGQNFPYDVDKFKRMKKEYSHNLIRYIDYVCRKCYYQPILKLIEKINRFN